jgi:cytochrome c oxidase subunit II
MRHFVFAGILVIAATFLMYFGLNAVHLMPVEASAQASEIDWMWDLQLKAMSFLFALIFVPMAYSLVVFRRREGDTTDAEHMEGNTRLEIAWTIVPLFIVMAYAYLGAINLAETRRADPEAMVVKVTAIQWSWTFEYPPVNGLAVVSDELHVPVGKQVLLRMTSNDVIHSFWVPELAGTQDVVPNQTNHLTIQADEPGVYEGTCKEFCGLAHAYMKFKVVAHTLYDENGAVAATNAVYFPEQLLDCSGKEAFAAKIKDHCAKAVIAYMKLGDFEGILYDAFYGLDLQEKLLEGMADSIHQTAGKNKIVFSTSKNLRDTAGFQEKLRPKVLSGEQSNTSIIYGNRYFLKMFRKIEYAIHPDLEISHFLTSHAHFEHIPAYVGSIEWRGEKSTMVLGMMQQMVEANGDAWTYMLERLDAFRRTRRCRHELVRALRVRRGGAVHDGDDRRDPPTGARL